MKNSVQLIVMLILCAVASSCNKYLGNPYNSISYDVDAQRFFDSSGVTDLIQRYAVNNFVKQLKDSSLWTKFMAIYPMVGGTPATTKWNLKDPRNSDDAYRLTFNGNPQYAATGVLFEDASDYGDTHLTDAMLIYNDNAISYYSRTQNTVDGYDMGCSDNIAPYNEMAIYNKNDATNWFKYYDFGDAPATTKGLFMLSSAALHITRYENGVATKSTDGPISGSTGLPILVGSVSHAPAAGMRECALATIGTGLTDAEAHTFYNIAQAFQASLVR